MLKSCLGTVCFFSFALLTVIAQQPLFTLDFSDGTNARTATGKVSPVTVPVESVILGSGAPEGGKSFRLSVSDELSYALNPSWFNINRGSLVFWIKPVDWGNQLKPAAGSNNFIPIMAIDAGLGHNWSKLFYVSYSAAKENGQMQISFRSMLPLGKERRTVYAQNSLAADLLQANQWSLVVLTWSSMDICSYINGKEVGSVSYGLPVEKPLNPAWKLWLMPKVFWKANKQQVCEFAGVKIYDQTFNAVQVKELYALSQAGSSRSAQAIAPVPLSSTLPALDGKLDAAEWADATLFPLARMNGNGIFNSDFPAEVMLKHDGKRLLVGFQAKTLELRQTAEANSMDRKVFNGSEFELSWRTSGNPELEYCQLAVAPNHAWAFRNQAGEWVAADFEHRTAVQEDGWSAELAIPFALLGISKPETLSMQFCMHRPEYNDFYNKWICWNIEKPQSMFFKNMGRIDLRSDALNVRLNWPGKLNYGDYQIEIASGEDLPYTMTLNGAGLALKEQGVLAEGGKNWQGKAPEAGIVTWQMQVEEAGNPVFQFETKFQVKEPLVLESLCFASEQRIVCKVDLQGLAGRVASRIQGAGLDCHLLLQDDKGVKVAAQDCVLKELVSSLVLPFKELAEGLYTLGVIVRDGKDEFRKEIPFARPTDIFLRDRKGLERELAYPYKPIQYQGEKISTVMSEYVFSGRNPFPAAASNDGKPVLDGPLELVLQIDGKEQKFVALSSEVLEKADDVYRAAGLMQSEDQRLQLKWRLMLAYDGMLRYDFTLIPAGKPLNINQLQVKAILPAENARYAMAANYQDDWTTKGKVEAFPSLWSTGTRRGFCLFSDNDANWFYPDRKDPLCMQRLPDGRAELTANLITSKVVLKEEASYVLGMMATPAKPVRPDWRTIRDGGWGKLLGQTIQIIGWGGMGNNIFYRIADFSQPNPAGIAYWQKRMGTAPAKLTTLLPYSFMSALPDNNPIYNFYYADWERKVGGVAQPRHDYGLDRLDKQPFYMCNPVCANKMGYIDYMAYYVDRFLQDYPVLIGLYTDGGGLTTTDTPYKDTNLQDVLRPNRRARNYSLFGARDAYERFYKIIRRHRGNTGIMYTHSWDNYYPAINSFNDLMLPGEEFMHSIQKGLHVYIEETPLEKWQSNYNSRIYGAGMQFLTQYRKFGGDLNRLSPELRREYTKPCLMMCLLHDVPMTGAWYADVEGYWKLFSDLQVTRAEFVGYWEEGAWNSDDDKVKASYYFWPDKADRLLILGNLKRENAAVQITTPGFDMQSSSGQDAFSGEIVDMNGSIPVEDFGFRVLHIKDKIAETDK